MRLSEKMTAKAGRIRGHYLGTTHSSELLLEYAPEVALLEEENEALGKLRAEIIKVVVFYPSIHPRVKEALLAVADMSVDALLTGDTDD